MAGSMEIVKALLPEMLSCESVQRKAAGPLGEDSGVQSDQALEHEGKGLLLKLGRRPEMVRPGRVGGSIQVLRTGVAEIDGIGIDDRTATFLRLVVDDCRVGARGRDRVKGQADEVFVL